MYGNSDEVLHDFMVKDEVRDANALLLDVHGLAANIGAERLAETADQLREALMNRDEKRYGELYQEYVAHLKAVLEDINKI
jgi:HPt (histidine-containing phosphotransfer) domain-containing protein